MSQGRSGNPKQTFFFGLSFFRCDLSLESSALYFYFHPFWVANMSICKLSKDVAIAHSKNLLGFNTPNNSKVLSLISTRSDSSWIHTRGVASGGSIRIDEDTARVIPSIVHLFAFSISIQNRKKRKWKDKKG